jgi:hypothetical protein
MVRFAEYLKRAMYTTVRALQPESHPRVLVSDTVGFIKNLPHGLVASFKSTLDEALEASLLAHVVDASDPGFERQLAVTEEVLDEIGAKGVPRLLDILRRQRFVNVYAGITLPNDASVGLHRAIGMEQIGTYERVGYKFGQWLGVTWFGMRLNEPADPPQEPIPFAELDR